MAIDYRSQSPRILADFLSYHETIKAHSQRTVDEYFLDLRNFFRYLKQTRDPALRDLQLDEIDIMDVDLPLIKSVTLSDIYGYMTYLSRDRQQFHNSEISNKGLNAASRARKLASLRSFFNYLCNKVHVLDENPCKDVDTPKQMRSLPRYLTLQDSLSLLESVDGAHRERDFCILTLFLNCGFRLSELCGLNLNDIRTDNTVRVVGKGNKERIVYLNDACLNAISEYLKVRPVDGVPNDHKKALFLSRLKKRISNKTVQHIVYSNLERIGLGGQGYSTHKLRHTAATLMYQYGNVDIRVLKDILGHENLGTTQIYTHLSNEQIKNAVEANPLANAKPKKEKE